METSPLGIEAEQIRRALLSDVEALRGVIDGIQHPIFVKDAHSRFLIVNDAMCSLMGRRFEELIGRCDQDFVSQAEADIFRENDRRVLTSGETNENEESFTDRNGAVRTFVTRKNRLILSDGTALLVGCITDISDFRRAEAAIRHHAEHDYLTGLPNRSLFARQLEGAVVRSGSADSSAALLLIDLDGFKAVNDLLGHAAGDNVLVQTANALLGLVSNPNDVARLGGDEFAIIQCAGRQPAAGERLARAAVARLARPTFVGRSRLAVSCSVGVAFAQDQDSDSRSLLRRADIALYAAKAEGRNCWRAYDPAMEASEGDR